MRMSVAVPTYGTALSGLMKRAGVKRRKKRRAVGVDAAPLVKTSSGGGKKSQRKGGRYQNVVAKVFERWYGCTVKSTPRSGGWATDMGFGPKGDLIFSDRKAPFHVECKKHERWELSDLLTTVRGLDTKSTNSIERWWKQTIDDCPRKKTGELARVPLLVFAKNRQPSLVMMYATDLQRLVGPVGPFMSQLRVLLDKPGDMERVVITLNDFITYVQPPPTSPKHKRFRPGISNGKVKPV